MVTGSLASEATDQGHGNGHADRGRGEVLHGEPSHLDEMAHRRLAAVVLPVGVGDEADGGVEREERRHRLDRRRVERQPALQALQGVQAEHRDQAEGDDGARVDGPRLLALRVDARRAVDEALERQEDAVAGRRAAAVHPGEVRPEQSRPEQQQPDEGGDLEPCGSGHRASPSPSRHCRSSGAISAQREVDQERRDDDEEDDVGGGHRPSSRCSSAPRSRMRAQPRTKRSATRKKPRTSAMRSTSTMPRQYPSGRVGGDVLTDPLRGGPCLSTRP